MKPLLVALLVASLSAIASPARAVENTTCTVSHPTTFNPPLTLTPGKFSYSTHGPTGTIACIGSLNGNPVTGSGTFTNDGAGNGSCAQGTGGGHFLALIPTAGGTAAVSGQYTFQYTGLLGTLSGSGVAATFEFVPTAGDCVTTPVTQVLIVGQFIIAS